MAEITSYPNPFPEARIKASAESASRAQLFVYALSSAQRAVTLGTEVLGTLSDPDQKVIDKALDASWEVVNGSEDEDLAAYVPALFERMLPEDEEGYTFYNSVVNDAFAATAYAIHTLTGPAESVSESAYYASENLFNLADLLLHRNRTGYVVNIAAEPIIAATLEYVESDLDKMDSRIPDLQPANIRPRLVAEGHHLAQLAS
ncbi:hypothetical protein [Mycobacteroides abscessus]|uniref:hypothetical protein n=1 Tax=Mycobacteroides abscessus TaxID=36809 RepID=UPI00092795AB|nr:hypothetical protein [Mycobacteroides abscessus]SHP45798.1 Uncharacterised protein [Mycobacteroides abscessus subsp. abscessus]SIE74649.1 Uncharacterised protein [Mycobacteroides abscessus subsp. abscessus]SIG88186.1 Uncharacterised protein [Mycobacteroides abscessus subsp. abscessus]SIG93488.1 Uncharacterised protein [Mycobacteroides abscessus subsp. abscessus]SIH06758.1 Uncharacterised protein [Mycobacteroides abscessus subsp. abscessus]